MQQANCHCLNKVVLFNKTNMYLYKITDISFYSLSNSNPLYPFRFHLINLLGLYAESYNKTVCKNSCLKRFENNNVYRTADLAPPPSPRNIL